MIGPDGAQLGIMSARDALNLAAEKNLDLVKIAPQATPPVCKIIDYGKYRFEQAKREKEARNNQRVVEIKEIRLSLNIDTHDFETKKNHAVPVSYTHLDVYKRQAAPCGQRARRALLR